MTTTFFSARHARVATGRALLGVICLATAPAPVCAQRAAAEPAVQAPASPAVGQGPAATAPLSEQAAHQTRQQLNELLSDHPPSLREVLQRDPALIGNAEYLSAYPRVAAFLAAHPEVARAPVYFLGEPERHLEVGSAWMWRSLLESISVGVLLLMGGLGFGWLVRTLLDHRRWQRVSRVQVETHSKVLDRLTSSEDLLAYMQTPAGRQFMESAPIALDGKAAPLAAPVGRILWSLQVGVVTLLGGLALAFVSRSVTVDAAEPLRVLGIVLMAAGAGFVTSAALSYALSRHLGLLRPGDQVSAPSAPRA